MRNQTGQIFSLMKKVNWLNVVRSVFEFKRLDITVLVGSNPTHFVPTRLTGHFDPIASLTIKIKYDALTTWNYP